MRLEEELPSDYGRGDLISIGGTNLYITDKLSKTEIRVQGVVTESLQGTAVFTRAYPSIQSWYAEVSGDLVDQDRREIARIHSEAGGLLLSDRIVLNGSTTDSQHYLELTAEDEHKALSDSGVVIDGANSTSCLVVLDSYTLLRGLAFRRCAGSDGRTAIQVGESDTDILTTDVIIDRVLIDDYRDGNTSFAIKVESSAVGLAVRNSIFMRGEVGIEARTDATASVHNCTFYDLGRKALTIAGGTIDAVNVLALNTEAIDVSTMDIVWTDDGSGTRDITPGAELFESIMPGLEDLHLVEGAEVLGVGANLSTLFTKDVDGDSRPDNAAWDVGADQIR